MPLGEIGPGSVVVEAAAGWSLVHGVGGVALGVLVGVAGLVLLWGDRVRRRGRVESPTMLALGVCGLVMGYHLVAWSLPEGMVALRVPASRWWLVAGGVAAAALGSLAADRLDRRAPDAG